MRSVRLTNNTNNNSWGNSQHVITASAGEHYFHWEVIYTGRAHILEPLPSGGAF